MLGMKTEVTFHTRPSNTANTALLPRFRLKYKLLIILHPLSVPQSDILLGGSPKSNFSCFIYNESVSESYFDINSTFTILEASKTKAVFPC